MKIKDMLNQCLEQMKNMTEEEFREKKLSANIIDEDYCNERYYNEDFSILMESTKQNYGEFFNKVKCQSWKLQSFITTEQMQTEDTEMFIKSIDISWEKYSSESSMNNLNNTNNEYDESYDEAA